MDWNVFVVYYMSWEVDQGRLYECYLQPNVLNLFYCLIKVSKLNVWWEDTALNTAILYMFS